MPSKSNCKWYERQNSLRLEVETGGAKLTTSARFLFLAEAYLQGNQTFKRLIRSRFSINMLFGSFAEIGLGATQVQR